MIDSNKLRRLATLIDVTTRLEYLENRRSVWEDYLRGQDPEITEDELNRRYEVYHNYLDSKRKELSGEVPDLLKDILPEQNEVLGEEEATKH